MPQKMYCWYCQRADAYHQTGMCLDDEGERRVEYSCIWCGHRHNRKDGIEDRVFLFFPSDIEAMASDQVEPLVFDGE